MMATGLGPDSPWVFLVVIAMLALVVIVDKRRESRSRNRRHRPCQVIGCDPRPATRWVELAGVWACDRCAKELDELSREERDSLADRCSFADCTDPAVAVVHGWPLCACHSTQVGAA